MSSKNPRHIYVYKNDDFFYKECKSVSPKIAEELRYHENESSTDSIKSPSSYGLENSEQIIPKYYFSGKDLTSIRCLGASRNVRHPDIKKKYASMNFCYHKW